MLLFRFENCSLDTDRRELHRAGESVAVEPQVFDLLTYLVENRDRVVTKDDLIAAVWSGRIVSESTLTSRINSARKALGDSGDEQRLIRTIARKGFRFVGEVQSDAKAAPDGEPRRAALPALDRPASVAEHQRRRRLRVAGHTGGVLVCALITGPILAAVCPCRGTTALRAMSGALAACSVGRAR